MFQPTPCMSPSGGSRESFSDVPRHTEQLLPSASERFRTKNKQQQQPSSSVSAVAPIASIRTSCSSCSDDAASTSTTVNSSVFADDCCCGTAASPLLPQRPPVNNNNYYNRGDGIRLRTSRGDDDDDENDDDDGRPFHDFGRFRPLHQPSPIIGGGRNVIVVQADVNPIADTIVNANSLSGSLRALYDASKETLF